MLKVFVPGEPRAQARPRGFKAGGRIMFYSPKSPWSKAMYERGRVVSPIKPLEGPLRLMATFVFKRPLKMAPGSSWCVKRPDLDNLAKGLYDAMTKAGWWLDDSQIVHETLGKVYASEGEANGVHVSVTQIVGGPEDRP